MLYNKYRPQRLDEVVGQDHVVRVLTNQIIKGSYAGAYLFVGGRGTGKTTVARILSRAVNCLADSPAARPCNTCTACNMMLRNTTSDIVELDAASNRSIEDIKRLSEMASITPAYLRRKVYIIDEAHQLSTHAKDALLKILEEPPAHLMFVMATTASEKIPATIRSRCMMFGFRPPAKVQLTDFINDVASRENVCLEEPVVELIASNALGSYRDAVVLLETLLSTVDGEHIGYDDACALLGLPPESHIRELVKCLAYSETLSETYGSICTAVAQSSDLVTLIRQVRDTCLGVAGTMLSNSQEEYRGVSCSKFLESARYIAASGSAMLSCDPTPAVAELVLLRVAEILQDDSLDKEVSSDDETSPQ